MIFGWGGVRMQQEKEGLWDVEEQEKNDKEDGRGGRRDGIDQEFEEGMKIEEEVKTDEESFFFRVPISRQYPTI